MSFETKAAPPEPGTRRISFDSAVWQVQDTGDFINTKTGETRDEDGFLSVADETGPETSSENWDAPQDAADGWHDGDNAGEIDDTGSHSPHGDPDAQVRPSSRAAEPGLGHPSKLPPRRHR